MLDDEVIEGDERFAVRLSSASGATIVDGEGVGTIRDDDVEEPPPGQPTLRIGDVTVDEDDGPAEFTVTLSETSVDDVTVAYATSDGTAHAGLDYTIASGDVDDSRWKHDGRPSRFRCWTTRWSKATKRSRSR